MNELLKLWKLLEDYFIEDNFTIEEIEKLKKDFFLKNDSIN